MLTDRSGLTISSWANAHGVKVLSEESKPFRHYFYISSKGGETLQFVIEPESHGMIRLDGHLIESDLDGELHITWESPVAELENILNLCRKTAEYWFTRSLKD